MTEEQKRDLKAGDVVKSRLTGVTYQVHGNYGDHAVAADIVEIAVAGDWDLIGKQNQI